VGTAKTISKAYKKAHDCDPISIFGGIIAANRAIDKATAEMLNQIFIEVVIAPDFEKDALEILTKKQNIRLLKLEKMKGKSAFDLKKVLGGMLIQDENNSLYDDLECVTKEKADDLTDELKFAMTIVKHVRSNAIVLTKDLGTIGLGIGQTNRIAAANQAITQAGENAKGAVMASDAFFPFPDCVEAAAKAGVKAIIQPGGSMKDADSIAACDKHKIAMYFCGKRHFKH
jgi:phosphoribosylaminoimidazolecarboxamide formyltransferase/IMP cyclohydrolase